MFENYIEKLDELIYEYTGPQKNITKKNVSKLTLPGENYCSLMLKVDVSIKDLENNKEEVLHIVAKCVNKSFNNVLGQMAPLQFKKEIHFYTTIVPILQEFQREQGVDNLMDVFPKVIGSRKNLNGDSDEIDDHAVILMENLKVQGYVNIQRQVGFDLESAKRVLKDLAVMHAVPVALKLKKPDIFRSMIEKVRVLDEGYLKIPKFDYDTPTWATVAEELEVCKPYLEKVKNAWTDFFKDNCWYQRKPCNEPLASLVHYDVWSNNIMLKFENGKLVKNKFVDFQMYQYANPILDVCFFIWSSVKKEVVIESFEDLVVHYQNNFYSVLETLGCDVAPLKHNFMEDVEKDCPSEIFHLLFMVFTIFGPEEQSVVDSNAGSKEMVKQSSITDKAKERIDFIFSEFGRRGWFDNL